MVSMVSCVASRPCKLNSTSPCKLTHRGVVGRQLIALAVIHHAFNGACELLERRREACGLQGRHNKPSADRHDAPEGNGRFPKHKPRGAPAANAQVGGEDVWQVVDELDGHIKREHAGGNHHAHGDR
jgi:hypothetical protein